MKFNSSENNHIFEYTNFNQRFRFKHKVLAPQNILQTYHVANIEPAILYNKQCELMTLLYSDFRVITISCHD